jgi:osmotically-inducible protein OsmY
MKIVTLSRQIGSLGEEIAALTAERAGLRLVDQAQVHELGQKCDPTFADACEMYEREEPKGFLERFFFNRPAYTSLFEALNYDLAGEGDVILFGRGAQVVLQELRGVLRVRIVAPLETRVERFAERHGVSRDEAREYVVRHTQQRRALIQNIYNVNLADWALYDLIVNTKDMTADDGAHILTAAVEKMQPVSEEAALKARLKRLAQAKRVESAIRKKVTGTALGAIKVDSDVDGEVILNGVAPDEEEKKTAGEIAAKFPGVEKVVNDIRVVPLYGI